MLQILGIWFFKLFGTLCLFVGGLMAFVAHNPPLHSMFNTLLILLVLAGGPTVLGVLSIFEAADLERRTQSEEDETNKTVPGYPGTVVFAYFSSVVIFGLAVYALYVTGSRGL